MDYGSFAGWIAWILFGFGAATLTNTRSCANAAICDNPPQWWKDALLRARARKAAADVLKAAKEPRP